MQRMIPLLIVGANQTDRLTKARELAAAEFRPANINLENNPDYLEIAPDPSISLERIKQAIKFLSQKPYQSKVSFVTILEANLATIEAQNALLKLLEEPPSYALIILTSPNEDGLLPTVVSRCQIVRLKTVKQTNVDPQAKKFLEMLLSQDPQAIEKLSDLGLTRQEVLSFFEQITLSAESDLSDPKSKTNKEDLYRLLKSLDQARDQIAKNANLRLIIANLILQL